VFILNLAKDECATYIRNIYKSRYPTLQNSQHGQG